MTQTAKLGDTLKECRTEKNISLKEAATATSIRMAYLQAIEEGDIQKLPSPVYAQGFVKQYANYLGIDGDSIVRENPEYFKKPNQQEFNYGIGTLEMRNNPGSAVKGLPNAMWIAVFAIILLAAWYLAWFLEVI